MSFRSTSSNSTLKHSEDLTRLFLLCREGTAKAAIEEFHERVRIINRFVLAAIIQSEPCLVVLRRELNRLPTRDQCDV